MIKDYQNKVFSRDTLIILKSLPDEIIDAKVTSPPYNIRWKRGKLLQPMDWLRKRKWTIRQKSKHVFLVVDEKKGGLVIDPYCDFGCR
jgi:DNA modification methylase